MDEKRKEEWRIADLYLNAVLLPEADLDFATEWEKRGIIVATEKNGNVCYIFSKKMKKEWSMIEFREILCSITEGLLEKEGL